LHRVPIIIRLMAADFQNLCVLTLESRRATEMSRLVETFGGRPLSAPAMQEVPIESNTEALESARALIAGAFDIVVLLTGVGLRSWLAVAEAAGERDRFVAALARVRVVARGPKPVGVLRELRIAPWVTAPEPNTWRELLAVIDGEGGDVLRGQRVALQEYGTSNDELLSGLTARGAQVTRVPVYTYELPDDLAPLQHAVAAILRGEVDVALFTTATQIVHLLEVAGRDGQADALRAALQRVVVCSIGPTTSEELREQGIAPDFDASHPKMGYLVREAAERGPALVTAKRSVR
jgi:uroporphyrinogen-III synthase